MTFILVDSNNHNMVWLGNNLDFVPRSQYVLPSHRNKLHAATTLLCRWQSTIFELVFERYNGRKTVKDLRSALALYDCTKHCIVLCGDDVSRFLCMSGKLPCNEDMSIAALSWFMENPGMVSVIRIPQHNSGPAFSYFGLENSSECLIMQDQDHVVVLTSCAATISQLSLAYDKEEVMIDHID